MLLRLSSRAYIDNKLPLMILGIFPCYYNELASALRDLRFALSRAGAKQFLANAALG